MKNFIDYTLAAELKNWLTCKKRFSIERILNEFDKGRLITFYHQTRRYIMNQKAVRKDMYG